MVVVIYSAFDMEPITIIDLPADKLKEMENTGGIRLKLANTKLECRLMKADLPSPFSKSIYVTTDEAEALMLKASYLPGQLNTLKMKTT